jgi:hypothetical protein
MPQLALFGELGDGLGSGSKHGDSRACRQFRASDFGSASPGTGCLVVIVVLGKYVF